MPHSLRLALMLLMLGALAAPVAIFTVYRQDDREARVTAEQITGGHVEAGRLAVDRFGCASCHQFSEIKGTQGAVGPPLKGVGVRATIAGVLPNQPEQMIRWLRHPQAVVPGNAMPEQGLSDREARDIAAYLYTLK